MKQHNLPIQPKSETGNKVTGVIGIMLALLFGLDFITGLVSDGSHTVVIYGQLIG
jgi:hypothetical protein